MPQSYSSLPGWRRGDKISRRMVPNPLPKLLLLCPYFTPWGLPPAVTSRLHSPEPRDLCALRKGDGPKTLLIACFSLPLVLLLTSGDPLRRASWRLTVSRRSWSRRVEMIVTGGLLLLAIAAPSVAGGAMQVPANSAANGMDSSDRAAGSARRLQSQTCDEDTIFVASLITDLNYPIGGCYEVAATALNGFALYSLGGAEAVGTAQIYVSDEGSWEIGMVEEVDEATGEAAEISMVCTTEPLQANAVAEDGGPTSLQLDGTWQCTYFQDGVTNYLPADFTGLECGCDGRTTVDTEGDSDDGELDTTAIAISALAALAVLAVFVCGCFIRLRRRRIQKDQTEAPKEDYAFSS